MIRTRSALALVAASAVVQVACDSASVYEDCAAVTKDKAGEPRCPPSTFPSELDWGRQVTGTVSSGDERIPNALVRVDAHLVTTDESGSFRAPVAPFRYDLTARLPEDVVTYRGVGYRFLDLAIERASPLRAWTSTLAIKLPNGPRPGHSLAFFGGAEVARLDGDVASALLVATRTFDAIVTIHAVEYPEGGDLAHAIAHGSVKVPVRGDGAAAGEIVLEPLAPPQTTTFRASAPSSLAVGDVEVIVDFGTRFSEKIVTRVPSGTAIALPTLPGAGWSARVDAVEAKKEGARASSGRVPFKPGEEVALDLFEPPEALTPSAEAVADARKLTASGIGVFEHVLAPLDGQGHTIHVVTTSPEAVVPDLTEVTLPRATGRYAWTVRSFPELAFVDSLSSLNARLYQAVSASGPRMIVLP